MVSDIKGTTTDPVSKAMELLPLGPVVMIDTPGLDDAGTLGDLRVKKAYQVLNKADIALLVVFSRGLQARGPADSGPDQGKIHSIGRLRRQRTLRGQHRPTGEIRG